MTHISRNPAGANGWASGDTSSYLYSRNNVFQKNNQDSAIAYAALVALVGRGAVSDAPCPLCGPGRRTAENRKRRVLRVWQSSDGFASYYCARCGIRGWARESEPRGWLRTGEAARPRAPQPDAAQQARIESALRIWQESVPLAGTLGQKYFVERCGLHVGLLDLHHCLRWHVGAGAVIGLMTDPITREACGVHRTCLEKGHKIGAAAHRFKDRFGHWPVDRSIQPLKPNAEVISWDRHCNIRYARAMAKQKAVA